MADKTPIARVSAIQGQAFVKEANGSLRPLHVGDTIYEGEVIVTVGQRSHVDLATPDGLTHVLRGNETLTADAESVAAIKADATDSALRTGVTDVNRVIQTINQGGDLDALLEETAAGAPAAGGAGAGADGGPSFVRLLRVAEGIDPLAFEYGTTRSTTVEEGIVGTGTTPVAAATVTAGPSLTVNVPTTNDATPTLTGTTDAPVGSTVTLTISQGATTQTVTATVQPGGTYSVDVPTALAEGPYSVTAAVTDAAGNTASASDPGAIDLTAPSLTVSAPDGNDATPTLSGTTDAPVGSTVTLIITQGSTTQTVTATVQAGGTYSVDVPTALGEGSYSVQASVTDAAGNTANASDPGAIDLTAPSLTVSAPDGNDTTPTLTGTTDAPVGSTVTLTITQGSTTQTVTATVQPGGTYSVDVPTALAEGPYSVTAAVTDAAGNTANASDPGAIDLTAPSLTVSAPDGNDTTPTLSGTTDAPVGSTVTLTITQGSTTQTVTATVQPGGTYSVDVPTALAEGPYSVTAAVTDAAGNTANASDPGAIDLTAPSLTVSAPDGNDTTPTLSGTTDAPVGSTVTLTITQGATTQTVTATVQPGGTYSVDVPTALAEGPYSVTAAVTDAAGNTASASDPGAIDLTAPSLTVSAPDGNDTTPTLSGTTDAPVGSTVTLTITQGATTQTVTATVQPGGTYSVDVPTALAEGPYSVTAAVTDAAGNTASASDPGAIDLTAPSLTVSAPDGNDTTPTLSGTTDAPVGSTVTLTITQGSTTQTVTATVQAGGTYSVDVPTALGEGSYSVQASVTDAAGNTANASDPGAIDLTAPSLTVSAPDGNDTTPTLSGTTDAPVGSTVTLTITQGATTQTVTATVQAGGTYSVDVPTALAEGPYSVTAAVTDAAGNTANASDPGAIDLTAPSLTVSAPDGNDTTPTLSGTTDAPVGSTVTLTITQGATTQTVTATVQPGGTYSVDVPTALAEGPYSVTAAVTDAAGNTASASDPGAIDLTAPSLTVSAPDGNDTTPTLSGTTDAPVGSTVTLTITQGATTQTVTATVQPGGTYSVDVPTALAEGPYSVTAAVTDAAGNTASASDPGAIDLTAPSLTVSAPDGNDTTPTLSGTTDAPVGSTVTLTITQGSTTQTVTATVQPGGTYSVDVPTALAEGPYSVTAAVTDAAGNTASASDPGAIDLTAPSLTVSAPDGNDATPTLSGTTDAPAGSTVTLTISQGSTTQTVTATVQAGGTYSVDVPTALGEGSYSVQASVTDAAGNTASASDPGAIDLSAPSITVSAPDGNDTTPTLTGTTDAPVGSTVTLTISQGATTQTVTATVQPGGTYSVDVPTALAEGPYSVTAAVTDAAGNTANASDPGAIDLTAPSLTVSAPDGNDTTPTLSGTTDAPVGSTVTLTITQGSTTQTVTATVQPGGTYSVDVPTALAEGPYSVTAAVTDAAGNTANASDPGAIDLTAPSLTVSAPDGNDTTPTLTGTTDAPVGSTVTLTISQGATTQTVTATVQAGGTYSVDVPTALVEGSYSVQASVTDAAGNTASASDPGAIDLTAPSLTVSAPDGNDTTPTLTGTTDAPVGSTVTLTITQGATTQTVTATVQPGGTYSVDVPTALAEGPYSVTAAVTDAAGNTANASDPGAIDLTAPSLTVSAPDGNDTTPTLSGTTDAPVGSTVTLTITQGATTQTVTATVQPGGTYSVDVPTALAEGPYSVTAAVTDAAGNTASASDPGAIDLTAPSLTVSAPDGNDTTPTLSGTTDAPVGSTVTLTITQGSTTQTVTATVQAGGTYSVDVPTALGEGSYSVQASVTDAAGNTANASDPGAIDLTAPSLTVSAPDGNDTTPTLSGTTDAPVGSTVTLTITQGATTQTVTATVQAGGTYSVDVPTALAEGPYSVTAAVTDAAGNTANASDPGAIDLTAPSLTVSAPDGNDTTPTLSGTTDAPVGSTVTLTITQGATTQTVTATVQPGGTYSVDVPTALAEGPYSVTAAVTDAAGNTASASDPGAIDLTAPSLTVSAPDGNDTTPTLSGTTDAPVGSTVTLTITQGSTTQTVTATVQPGGTYSVDVPTALAEGPYSVTAAVTDAAGNTANASDPGAIDLTAPSLTVSAPDGNDTTPTLSGTTDAPVGSTVTLTITQGATTQTVTATVQPGGTYSVDVPTALAEGPYSVTAAVTDAAGNTASASDPGAIDLTAPSLTVSAPDGNDTTPTLSGTTDAPVGSTVTLTITQGSTTQTVTATVQAGGTYSVDVPTALGEGSYSVQASVTDAAGNTANASDPGAIDLTAPSLTVSAPDGNDTTPTLTGTTDAPVGSTVTLTITQGSTTQTVTATVQPGGTYSVDVPTALAEGPYSVTAAVTDAAGNTANASDPGAIDLTAPSLTVSAPDGNDTTPTLSGTTDAPVGSTVTLTITQGSTTQTVTATVQPGGTYSVDVPTALAEGPYSVTAAVTDAAGNTANASDPGAIDLTAPSLTVSAPDGNDTTPTLSGTTDAPVGSTVTLTITQGATTQTVTATVQPGGTYSVDVPTALAEGPYSVTAAVTDAAGNTASASDPGAIDLTAPSLTVSAPDGNDTTPTLSGTTDAPVGSTVTLTITQGSTTQTVTATVQPGGTYSVDVPTALGEGSYSVQASVTDAAGNTASASDPGAIDLTAPSLTVSAPDGNDTTPTLSGTTDAPVGSTVTLTITQGATTQTVTATVQPGGTYSVDVPTALAEGPYSVTAAVTDAAGNTASASDPGAIDLTAPSLTVSAPDGNDTTPTLSGTTDAPVGSTVTLTITQGSTTQTVTATVQPGGTYSVDVPTALAEGPYSVTAAVTDAAGNTANASDPGAIDLTAPSLTVSAPDGNDTTPTLSGTTDAPVGSTVTLTITQGATTQTVTATVQPGGTYSVDVPTALAEGPYSVTAAVTDAAGNTASASDPGAIDLTAPSLTVSAPDGNDTTPTLSGTTDAPVGSTVTLTITQGSTTQTVTATVQAGGTYSVDVPTALGEGSYSVQASVTDAAGNTANASDPGAIDLTAPSLTVSAPDGNDTTPTLTGTTDAPVGSTVTLTITQGSTTQTVTATVQPGGTYSVDVPTALAEGPYSVTAAVTDAAGNTANASDPGAIDLTAPSLTVSAPDGNDTTPTLSGTTDAPVGSTVTLTITQGSTTQTVTATAQPGGTYSVDVPTALAEGPYSVTAAVTDAAGNTANASDPGAIDLTAPSLTVSAPDGNDTTPTLSGTTDAPVGSTVTLTITQGATTQTVTATVQPGGTYSVDVPTALAEGPYSVTAAVTDAAGNTASASDPGAIDLTAPSLTVSAPDGNDTTPTLSGTTDAPVGSTVTLTITQGSTTQTVTATVQPGGTYSVDVPTALAEGPYSVTAAVTDAAGNTASASDPGSVNMSPVTTNVSATGNEDPSAPITVVLAATDADGSIDHYIVSSLPTHGTLYVDAAMTQAITAGQSVAGPVYFMPNSNWSGNTSFNYAAVDNLGQIDSTPAQANVVVIPVADQPVLQIATTDLFVLTQGNTVISTGATDREIVPGPTDYQIGAGVTQSNLEAELGVSNGYLDNRFDPVGSGVVDPGFVDIIDGKLTESSYAMTPGMTVTWDYAFKNGEDLNTEVAAGYNDVVVLVVTDPLGNKQSYLVDSSEEKFPLQISNGNFSFTATMPGTYTFDWMVLNSGDNYKDSSLLVNKPQFSLTSDPSHHFAAPVSLGTLASLTDSDGSETLIVTIANVPTGAAFSTGTSNADGSVWTFTAAQLVNLELLPPTGYSGSMDLLVTATSTELANHATASTSQHITIAFSETTSTYTTSTESAQSLAGTSGNDLIRGYAGNDTIAGGNGNDIVYGGAGNDTLQGEQGYDKLYGGVGNDSLNGGAGNDSLYGGAGTDNLDGGANNDLLAGGSGNDNLTGGLGADVFQWNLGDAGSAGSPAVDTVTDFSVASRASGGDVLDLRDLLQGEHSSLSSADHVGNLSNYLHFTVSGDTTTVQISSSGGFAGGFNASAVDQQVILSHADLSAGGLTTDQLIIQDLLSKGKLITD